MSDSQVEATTAKKKKNNKDNNGSCENGKKSQLLDTVKVGQNKKDGAKKKKEKIDDNSTSTLNEQKKQKKVNKKEEQETKKEDDSETECEDNNVKEDAQVEQKAKKEKHDFNLIFQLKQKGAKKEKVNNKLKFSAQDYIKDANKPFNSATLESNLKAKTTLKKANIDVALTQGVDEGKLSKKAYGSAIVYWYNQDLLPLVSKEEIEQLTESILKKQTENSEINQTLRNVNAQLTKIMQEKTDEQLQQEIEKYTALLKQQEEEFQFYNSEQYFPEDINVVKTVEEKVSKIEGIFKRRKRICEDAVKELIENLEETKNVSQMFETIGIDDGNQL